MMMNDPMEDFGMPYVVSDDDDAHDDTMIAAARTIESGDGRDDNNNRMGEPSVPRSGLRRLLRGRDYSIRVFRPRMDASQAIELVANADEHQDDVSPARDDDEKTVILLNMLQNAVRIEDENLIKILFQTQQRYLACAFNDHWKKCINMMGFALRNGIARQNMSLWRTMIREYLQLHDDHASEERYAQRKLLLLMRLGISILFDTSHKRTVHDNIATKRRSTKTGIITSCIHTLVEEMTTQPFSAIEETTHRIIQPRGHFYMLRQGHHDTNHCHRDGGGAPQGGCTVVSERGHTEAQRDNAVNNTMDAITMLTDCVASLMFGRTHIVRMDDTQSDYDKDVADAWHAFVTALIPVFVDFVRHHGAHDASTAPSSGTTEPISLLECIMCRAPWEMIPLWLRVFLGSENIRALWTRQNATRALYILLARYEDSGLQSSSSSSQSNTTMDTIYYEALSTFMQSMRPYINDCVLKRVASVPYRHLLFEPCDAIAHALIAETWVTGVTHEHGVCSLFATVVLYYYM